MKATDIQKILTSFQGVVGDSFDHLASRFEDLAESAGDELAPLGDFAANWKKLTKAGRRLFVEQLLKSGAMVVAGSLAAKAGIKLAGKSQKEIRSVILAAAELIGPLGKTAKKAKKKAKKAKKKLKKAVD